MVQLDPMTEEQFRGFLEPAIRDYARDLVEAGNAPPDAALEESDKQFHELLPNGLATPGQHLMTIRDEAQGIGVGFLWLGIRDRGPSHVGFLYEFQIHEAYRRQGYGRQALEALERLATGLELNEIRLHVFGHNQAAVALYSQMGYVPTNISMAKRLVGAGPGTGQPAP